MPKKPTFWRDFTIGVASSITASAVVAIILGRQISNLEAELKAKQLAI